MNGGTTTVNWIFCKDKLPDDGKEYLLCDKDYNVFIGTAWLPINMTNAKWIGDPNAVYADDGFGRKVIAYAEKPLPPKQI